MGDRHFLRGWAHLSREALPPRGPSSPARAGTGVSTQAPVCTMETTALEGGLGKINARLGRGAEPVGGTD